MKIALILLGFILVFKNSVVMAETALEKTLKQNERYKEKTEALERQDWFNEGSVKVEKYLEDRKKQKPLTKTQEAELYYEGIVSDRPCSHCPQYLNLIKEVNKVVEKTEVKKESAADYNKRMIELNKLKFMYFATREKTETGATKCNLGSSIGLEDKLELKGNTKLLAEDFLHMPNVTSLQYMPKGNEEDVYYYYRGEGADRNVIIEVKMSKDGVGRVRYYNYEEPHDVFDPNRDLPDLGSDRFITNNSDDNKSKDDNYFDFKMDVKTKKVILPTDVEIAEAGTKTELNENLALKSKTNLAFNTQKTSLSLANSTGDDWLRVEAKNKTLGETSLATVIPMEVQLDKESDLKFGGELKREIVKDFNKDKSKSSGTNTVSLGLTDQNHEYFNAELIAKEEGLKTVALGSKFKVGEDSKISGKYQFDNEDNKKYILDGETQYGEKNSLTGKYEYDNKGNQIYSVGNKTNMGRYGSLTTSYGVKKDDNQFIEVAHEKKINDTASMVLAIKTDTNKETTVMYQFQAKF